MEPSVRIDGDHVIAIRRGSHQSGSLLFLLNLEHPTATTTVTPGWPFTSARDLIGEVDLALERGSFQVSIPYGQVRVIHLDTQVAS